MKDTEIAAVIEKEEQRQQEGLELIPSENYTSKDIREALGSVFTHKYSEGYPGKRYYGGQENTDTVETLAIERAKELFSAAYVNVQPHSGASANLATYTALLNPGDTVLGMDLTHGGHLTHGHKATLPAQIYNFISYKTKDGDIDFEELQKLTEEHKPKFIIAGFSAYTRTLDYKKFVEIAKSVDAYTMADVSHIAGFIASGVFENPLTLGFDVMTSTTHKTLRGPRGGIILTNNAELGQKIDKAVFPGTQGGPHMHTICAKAVCFKEAATPEFKEYTEQILKNTKAMEVVFKREGVEMVTGGTDNHMLMLNTQSSFSLGGKESQHILESVGMTTNMNTVPGDTSAVDPSGLRLGTPALTTRGLKEGECARIAELIIQTLKNNSDQSHLDTIRNEVKEIAEQFPIPETFV